MRHGDWRWAALAALPLVWGVRAEAENRPAYDPPIQPASDEPLNAMRQFSVPGDLRIELVAAEPLLANPVAFYIDNHLRFYVAETYRAGSGFGVPDNRDHPDWVDADLAARTVEDRLAYYLKYRPHYEQLYRKHHDRVRFLFDSNGDGTIDRSTVFADGFNDILDGIGSGVLEYRGNVYYTCIPHLWLLRDTDGDGVADERKSLHYGYGVRTAFYGHDMHGLIMGPDGKLYFSIGDRGAHVKTEDGRIVGTPETGSVFRCNPDGSELEEFATGLRNPQELAFDAYGNLFTGDNNSDSGDRAKWYYVVEGGDHGWRMAVQYLPDRGPYNRERIWHPRHPGQPAWIIPPLANIGNGPSGVTYLDGESLPGQYRGSFLLCDFRGASSHSGVHQIRMKPKGAGFEVTELKNFVWGTLATDVDMGPDGNVYILDWVHGWRDPQRGRIYRVYDPNHRGSEHETELRNLIAQGMADCSLDALAGLLSHSNMRVRRDAQYELAHRGEQAVAILRKLTEDASTAQLAQIHAVWALGQIARAGSQAAADAVVRTLAASDDEVRAQAAKTVGELRLKTTAPTLRKLLSDTSPRVRFFAAMSLGKLADKDAIAPLVQMLRENADQDVYLRHAGVMGLAGIGDVTALLRHAEDASPAVRMGVLLALRRLARPEIARFLHDGEPLIVVEAARAIHDVPITDAMDDLAGLINTRPITDDALLRRVLNANYRLGGVERAAALAIFARNNDAPADRRAEAVEMLTHWAQPSARDRVHNMWRPIDPRPAQEAVAALSPIINELLQSNAEPVRRNAVLAAAHHRLRHAGDTLLAIVVEGRGHADTQVAALQALATLEHPRLGEAVRAAVQSKADAVRGEGYRQLGAINPVDAVAALRQVLDQGNTADQRNALSALAAMKGAEADRVLAAWMDKLLAGEVAPVLQLDVLEAAQARNTPELASRLSRYQASLDGNDRLARFRVALHGGNADNGRRIFFEKIEVNCQRCHTVAGKGGGEVGPDLTKIGALRDRDYLLRAIVDPNADIADGYEFLTVQTTFGDVINGRFVSETETELRLNVAGEGEVVIAREDIHERSGTQSSMPTNLIDMLKPTELRDLVEFLAQQKGGEQTNH